ncbi:hypothetical protein ElyMa_002925300 [Elysia marginata]|uniref:Secreted protein n=1 Tax=Elysia marginata TaxID=1093978 RepID=A0AAV4I3D4_9GAST|nr:hypothetical protein ElyMa_002925300 [Elysia marginata]
MLKLSAAAKLVQAALHVRQNSLTWKMRDKRDCRRHSSVTGCESSTRVLVERAQTRRHRLAAQSTRQTPELGRKKSSEEFIGRLEVGFAPWWRCEKFQCYASRSR